MTRLILAQTYRMKKYRITRHLLIPVCVLAVFAAVALSTPLQLMPGLYGSEVLWAISQNYPFFAVLFLVPVVCQFTGAAFKSKTICYEFFAGYKPEEMVMSRLLVACAAVWMISAAAMLIFCLIQTAANGWCMTEQQYSVSQEYGAGGWGTALFSDLLCGLALIILCILETAALSVFCAMLTGDAGLGLLMAWGIYGAGFVLCHYDLYTYNAPALTGKLYYIAHMLLPGEQLSLVSHQIEGYNMLCDGAALAGMMALSGGKYVQFCAGAFGAAFLECGLLFVLTCYKCKKGLKISN